MHRQSEPGFDLSVDLQYVRERWEKHLRGDAGGYELRHGMCLLTDCYEDRLEGVPCCAMHQLLLMANP